MKQILSILRQGQYDLIRSMNLNGKILDLGGSTKSGYQQLFKGKHTFTTVNINHSYGCDLIFNIEQKFPIKDKQFDHVICFNVLEHIYNFENVISESYRILKSKGKIIISTPFMHHIHGSPEDYFRYSESALIKILHKSKFKNIQIKELGYGLFSLIFQTIYDIFPSFSRNIFKKIFVSFDKLLLNITAYRCLSKRIPLGYFIIGNKYET